MNSAHVWSVQVEEAYIITDARMNRYIYVDSGLTTHLVRVEGQIFRKVFIRESALHTCDCATSVASSPEIRGPDKSRAFPTRIYIVIITITLDVLPCSILADQCVIFYFYFSFLSIPPQTRRRRSLFAEILAKQGFPCFSRYGSSPW